MNDLKYISDPFCWNLWCCPIVRRKTEGGLDTAYLFCKDPVIRYGNVWNPQPSDREERYESHAAILAAGWQVD
jgi:hypothetical protein